MCFFFCFFLIVFIDFQYEITKLQITIVITLQTMAARNTRKEKTKKKKRTAMLLIKLNKIECFLVKAIQITMLLMH